MADIVLNGPKLPFVLRGTGTFTVHAGKLKLNERFPADVETILDVEATASGSQPMALGGEGSWTLSVKSSDAVRLLPVWPANEKAAAQYRLEQHFAANPDTVGLVLTVGASAEGTFEGQFRYSVLTASANVAAGGDLSFVFCYPYPADTPAGAMIEDFFGRVRLPATLSAAPPAGELVKFEYGGYLNFGGGLGAGYEIDGTPSAAISDLVLSEHYDLSVIGKLNFTARLGGFFSVETRASDRPAWTNVVVRKTRASEFTAAADASVGMMSDLEGAPDQPNEFLGALLGVNVKNWLNLLDDVGRAKSWDDLVSRLDPLAIDYLKALLGKEPGSGTFTELVAKAGRIASDHRAFDPAVVSAFDRYFDKLTDPEAGKDLAAALTKVAHLPSWSALEGEVNPLVWKLVNELTDGDPLGWIVGKAVGGLQKRAEGVLDLGNADAHADLHAAVSLIKKEFGLTPLFGELAKIGTVADLKAQGGRRLDGLVERLLGEDLKKLSNTQLGGLVTRIRQLLDAAGKFEERAYAQFKEAAKHTLTFNLHAEYSKAENNEALIDMDINMATPEGLALIRDAASGDFRRALSETRPGLVRLNRGRLTHELVEQSALKINVVGWHAGWHYQSLEKLVLRTDQQIVPGDRGGLTVYTATDLRKQTDKQNSAAHRRTFTNFLLRFLGESSGVITQDPENVAYLVDAITRMSAEYELGFQGDRTRLQDLAYYLSFARDFGLTGAALQATAIVPLLPPQGADNYGPMSATYSVRYRESGLKALFGQPLRADVIRSLMRKVILSQYLHQGGVLASVGWAYWTPGVYTDIWKQEGPASFPRPSAREFKPISESPFAGLPAPASAVVQPAQQNVLNALYLIEDGLVDGLTTLQGLIAKSGHGEKMSPHAFENALGRIGDALRVLDDFGESVNTTFAVFDALVAGAGGPARAGKASSLTLQSQAAGHEVTKVFVSH